MYIFLEKVDDLLQKCDNEERWLIWLMLRVWQHAFCPITSDKSTIKLFRKRKQLIKSLFFRAAHAQTQQDYNRGLRRRQLVLLASAIASFCLWRHLRYLLSASVIGVIGVICKVRRQQLASLVPAVFFFLDDSCQVWWWCNFECSLFAVSWRHSYPSRCLSPAGLLVSFPVFVVSRVIIVS